MPVDGFISTLREQLKHEVPYKQELIQVFLFTSWVIQIANNDVGLSFFLTFLSSVFYHAHNFCWGKNKPEEWSFVLLVFTFTAALKHAAAGVQDVAAFRVVIIFQWAAFALLVQDDVNSLDILN